MLQQKLAGLEQHEGEQIMKKFFFWVNNPFIGLKGTVDPKINVVMFFKCIWLSFLENSNYDKQLLL